MADTVQYYMESMIPELEDYQTRGIFTAQEVKQIVQKRRDFEYALKRTPMRKVDGLRYIEYELNLDALRRTRTSQIEAEAEGAGQTERSKFDSTIRKRIHMLFNRLLLKFYGDLGLWVQYMDLCKRLKSVHALSKLFGQCLQYHPKEEALWIEASKFEAEQMANMDAARLMLQRGLRILPKSTLLWKEYLRLELLFVYKLSARRRVLGLPVQQALDADKQAILDGAIPTVVVKSAIEANRENLAFRIELLGIADQFVDSMACVAEHIVQTMEEDFPQAELALHSIAKRGACSLESTVQAYDQAMEKCPSALMLEYFVSALEDASVTHPSALSALRQVWSRYHHLVTSELYLKRIDFELRRQGIHEALAVAHDAIRDTKALLSLTAEQHQQLHLCYIELMIRSNDFSTDAIDAAFQHSLKEARDTALLWQRYSEWVISCFPSTRWAHDRLSSCPLKTTFVRFCFEFCDLTSARHAYSKCLSKPLLPDADTLELLLECVAIERSSSGQTDNHQTKHVVHLFERLVDLFPARSELWIKYIQYYECNQEFAKANEIRWRAQKNIEDICLS